jgi:hypothetical protein
VKLLAQIVTQVAGAARVLDHHLVAALAAVDQALQQRLARTRNAARAVVVVFGIVVSQLSLPDGYSPILPFEISPV